MSIYDSYTLADLEILRQNFTNRESDDEHLLRCWHKWTCGDCLREPQCSWCPFTFACIPNSYAIPLLAPAWDENICPYWGERWHIRTVPLGCEVSTVTTLASLVSIVSTLLFVLLVFLLVRFVRWFRGFHKGNPSWWRVQEYNWRAFPFIKRQRDAGEEDPLLGSSRNAESADPAT